MGKEPLVNNLVNLTIVSLILSLKRYRISVAPFNQFLSFFPKLLFLNCLVKHYLKSEDVIFKKLKFKMVADKELHKNAIIINCQDGKYPNKNLSVTPTRTFFICH